MAFAAYAAPACLASRESLVMEALEDHTMVDVIAAHAGLPVPDTRELLEALRKRGLVERYTAECWGLR